jgi:hypothetical protein
MCFWNNLQRVDSTHHFFRNACTKSGSLRFSQFSGCWLILSVYVLMSFDLSPSTTTSPLKYFNYESKCQKHSYVTHWQKISLTLLLTSLSLYIFTSWKSIVHHCLCRDRIYQICAAIYQLLLHMVFTSRNWFAMQGPVAIILIQYLNTGTK